MTARPESAKGGGMVDSKNQGEQRRAPRVSLGLLIQVRASSMDEFKAVHCENISLSGMFLRTRERRPLGTEVFFQLNVTGAGAVIEGLGRVVRITDDGVGIEFVSLVDTSEEMVRALVEERLRASA